MSTRKKSGNANPPAATQSIPEQVGVTPNQSFKIVRVWRSQIKLAAYNPRIMTDERKAALKRSLKYFGLLEPLVLNMLSSTLVGGHQRLTELDGLNGYPEKDYQLDVAAVELSPEKEMEANIALNNPNLQGEFDFFAVAGMGEHIDFSNAGYSKSDQDYFKTLLFEDTIVNKSVEELIDTFEEIKAHNKEVRAQTQPDDYLARKEAVQKIKQGTADKVKESTQYVTILLPSTALKNQLLAHFGKPANSDYLQADEVFKALELPFEEDTPPPPGDEDESTDDE